MSKKLNKNGILLVLPFKQISLRSELSNPPCFRWQGVYPAHDTQTKDGGRKSLCLILNFMRSFRIMGRFYYNLICPCIYPSVCSLLRYLLNIFLPPFPEVGCPIFLEIQNPWGKVVENCGIRFEHFSLKVV